MHYHWCSVVVFSFRLMHVLYITHVSSWMTLGCYGIMFNRFILLCCNNLRLVCKLQLFEIIFTITITRNGRHMHDALVQGTYIKAAWCLWYCTFPGTSMHALKKLVRLLCMLLNIIISLSHCRSNMTSDHERWQSNLCACGLSKNYLW